MQENVIRIYLSGGKKCTVIHVLRLKLFQVVKKKSHVARERFKRSLYIFIHIATVAKLRDQPIRRFLPCINRNTIDTQGKFVCNGILYRPKL